MMKLKSKKSVIFIMSTLAVMVLLWSCSKDDNGPIVLVPTIESVSPTFGEIGDEVTITGTNFNIAAIYNEIRFNGVSTIATSSDGTTIKANVPPGSPLGAGNLTVKAYGVTTDALIFTVKWPPPVISYLSPGYGYPGETITIKGENYSSDIEDVEVSFAGTSATVVGSTGTTISVIVPAGATTGNVTVSIVGQASNSAVFFVPVNPATVSYLIGPSADDVEESVSRADGHTENGSGGLNFGKYDDYQDPDIGKVLVGVRHPGVAVPQGATIISAHLQCEVYEVGNNQPTQMTIYGDNSGDAGIFAETIFFGVSSRPKTSATVVWDIPEWLTVADRGVDQRTPDLREIVQEIVNRADWVSGNAMCFMLYPTGPSADPQLGAFNDGRVANGGTGDGPSLVIIYEQ